MDSITDQEVIRYTDVQVSEIDNGTKSLSRSEEGPRGGEKKKHRLYMERRSFRNGEVIEDGYCASREAGTCFLQELKVAINDTFCLVAQCLAGQTNRREIGLANKSHDSTNQLGRESLNRRVCAHVLSDGLQMALSEMARQGARGLTLLDLGGMAFRKLMTPTKKRLTVRMGQSSLSLKIDSSLPNRTPETFASLTANFTLNRMETHTHTHVFRVYGRVLPKYPRFNCLNSRA